ncbi:hypothetical protein DXV76_17710 [Rhodobacteraceae bacterium CCMM004]|nr:hypothetical protein DXV76_17710 [Rhodobacteraceae bacterium CCMM004]
MAFARWDGVEMCSYPGTPLRFRGPRRRLDGDYVAVLGGSEAFGRYVEDPFPDLLQDILGRRVVNLAVENAGPDVYLNDPTVLSMAAGASARILQVPGAHTLSNRFYSVHPRRNDRLIGPSAMLRAVYPEVDFTEFHFVRHMLETLLAVSPPRFGLVREELRRLWVARTNLLLSRIGRADVLVWLGDRLPDDAGESLRDGGPPFVTRAMLSGLRGRIGERVEMMAARRDLDGKTYPPGERAAALALPGPAVHEALADALARALAAPDERARSA